MKPIRLVIQAFGPYKDRVELDFSSLEEHTLFLITGPTGAGKTSILDAMVYALYGQTSGSLRDGADMRSDFSDIDTATYVSFIFSIGQTMYKIDRSPKQMVKRKRGPGLKEQSASASLYRWKENEHDWHMITSSSQVLKERVQEIIGFRADQFLQVVLLPQGEFRKLLVASTTEREELLHNLFKTEIYTRLQHVLKERFDAAYEEASELVHEEERILQQEGVGTLGELEMHVTNYKHRETSLLETLKQADGVLQKATCNRTSWMEYTKIQKELEGYEEMHQKLMREENTIEALINKLRVLTQLKPIIEVMERTLEEEKQCEAWKERKRQLFDEKEELKVIEKDVLTREQAWQEQQSACQKATLRLGQLQDKDSGVAHLKRLETLVEEKEKERIAVEKKLSKKKELQKAVTETMEKERAALDKVDAWLLAHRDDAKLWEQEKQRHHRLKELIQWKKEKEKAIAEYDTVTHELSAMEETLLQTKHEAALLQQAFQLAQAYQLSTTLVEGEPCMVCGAVHHPRLAVKPEATPTKVEVDKAYTDVQTLQARICRERAKCEALGRRQQDVERQIESCLEDLDISSVAIADEALRSCEAMLDTLARSNEEWKVQEAQRDLYRKEREAHGQEKDAYQVAIHQCLLDIERLVTQVTTMQKELEERYQQLGLTGDDAYETIVDELKRTIDAHEREGVAIRKEQERIISSMTKNDTEQATIDEQVRAISETIEDHKKTYLEALKHLGISEEAVALYRSEMELVSSWQETIQTYEKSAHENQALIHSAKERLTRVELPETMIDDDVYKALQEERDAAYGAITTHRIECERLENVVHELQTLQASHHLQTEQLAFITRLHELANGGVSGLRGVTFERYVLGAILDEVMYAANERLHNVSRGRYELQRDTSIGGRGGRGLDLVVLDTYTGMPRPANTLSGGEMFLASLSLALGLADVIQSYAGGIHMDTMFIDEGFGTLDAETLEIALDTLVSLQASGRLIGVISHVAELKERIPAHLVITRLAQGSTAQFRVS